MTEFSEVVDERINKIIDTLRDKGIEYSGDGDVFHTFKTGASIVGSTPEAALKGMMLKQLVSVFDLIGWAGTSDDRLSEHLIDEKIGDLINYLILLEGMLKQRVEVGEANEPKCRCVRADDLLLGGVVEFDLDTRK